MITSEKARYFAPVVLRLALTAVFAWFGFSQVMDASSWVRLVPEWATGIFGLSAVDIVHMNGVFEIVAAILLGIGVYARYVATVLALHLFVITFNLGLTATGVRDFGLSFATATIALFGDDQYCLTHKTAIESQVSRFSGWMMRIKNKI